MPVLTREFEAVEIEIRDDTGRPVPFERGEGYGDAATETGTVAPGYFSITQRGSKRVDER